MKITIRLIVSLVVVVAVVALAFSLYQVGREKGRLAKDLERRSLILAESLQESLAPLIQSNAGPRLNRIVNRFGNRERLKGIMVFDRQGAVITATSSLDLGAKGYSARAVETTLENQSAGDFETIEGQGMYIFVTPVVKEDNEAVGSLALFYDASYIDGRLKEIWKHNLVRFVILAILVVFCTVLVVRWSITGPIARLAEWMRDVRTAKPDTADCEALFRSDVLASLVSEMTQLAKSLSIALKRVEEEARLRLKSESLWTPERLKEYMRGALKGKKLFVASNREPYMHVKESRW
jgi:uncharacterized membrane protein affecting hemolysin expression